MNKKSTKQKKKDYTLALIKKELIDNHGNRCCICQKSCSPDLMHVLPKSIYPEHYLNPSNLVLGCRTCHQSFDDNQAFRKLQFELYEQVAEFDILGANRYFGLNK
jgi:5-methylcytosine-specific restriction endonuclease McrA